MDHFKCRLFLSSCQSDVFCRFLRMSGKSDKITLEFMNLDIKCDSCFTQQKSAEHS
ncbi:unnamed protein product [Hymenolepis diminuta]|uniref:Uncharacterized protein n=1 Tax=Hymenolepis diminuta TaxID=6216 RepID=A0A564Y346_HYMDI|nr:unnamed protein product [Hymenolepis diminuta]